MPLVKINGRSVRIDAPEDTPLLWALRDIVGDWSRNCQHCVSHDSSRWHRSCTTRV
jgi:aerobic-type carbon monoxide dehydrogenase small subunit (CoxS/CutS family)